MFCSHCGNQLLDEAVICPHCGCPTGKGNYRGVQPNSSYVPSEPKTNVFALIGFIFSFLSAFCWLGLIFSIVGLVQTCKRGEKGKGLAIAGIVISVVKCVLIVCCIWLVIHAGDHHEYIFTLFW